MKSFYILAKIILMAVVVSLFSVLPTSAQIERIHGKAFNSDGDVVFFEEHIVRYERHRIATMSTIYYDTNFKKIGELVSDFSQGSQVGSYDFTDERLQYKDGAKVMPDRILIYSKKTPKSDIKEKTIQRESGQIVGQGFHPFIVRNLDRLAKGEIIPAKLVLPAQMGQYDVRICQNEIENSRIRIRIEMDNWFLRLFAPHVDVVYNIDTRQLLSYKGVSVVADASGSTIPVTVSYEYTQHSLLASSQSNSKPTHLESN